MNDPNETLSLHFEFDLDHPREKVWRALTDPELLSKWIMETDFFAELGREFTFSMEPSEWWDGIVRGEVLTIEPLREISYTWKGGPAPSPLDTVIVWKLEDNGKGGTRLILEHSGFVQANKFAYDGAKQGWVHRVDVLLNQVLESV